MKKSRLSLLMVSVLFAAGLLFSGSVSANGIDFDIYLDFDPEVSTISVGESLDVDIVISGLPIAPDFAYVSGYAITVGFDDTILGFDDYALGPYLGAPDDSFDLSWGDLGGGQVDVAEVSFLEADALIALQPDTAFTLATLSFTGLNIGTSPLSFDYYDIALSIGGCNYELVFEVPNCLISVGDGSVNVVPEPTTLLLFGIGLAGLAGIRRRSRS